MTDHQRQKCPARRKSPGGLPCSLDAGHYGPHIHKAGGTHEYIWPEHGPSFEDQQRALKEPDGPSIDEVLRDDALHQQRLEEDRRFTEKCQQENDMAKTKLDSRERRTDLTSRDCASILGGLIGGLIENAESKDAVRDAVKHWAANDDLWKMMPEKTPQAPF